ncbi:hypothetical protein NliqN6_2881 [Naganishia liquefaciens]|uniref:Uncharacterized protein n=1 Tax=Naganishia liquefaciens TaxID=104408 RepID=A0A8H3TUN4_9TREE|nr:hypothetical protein NliqN6_2881 [Naganishia liquefaciens]
MILPTDQSATAANSAPPAYTSAEAPAPRYSPKKDYGKAFAELQGRFGYDGVAPILISSDQKPKAPKMSKNRSDSNSSTESDNKSFVKNLKRFVSRSPTPPKQSPASAKSSSCAKPSQDVKVEAHMEKQTAGV